MGHAPDTSTAVPSPHTAASASRMAAVSAQVRDPVTSTRRGPAAHSTVHSSPHSAQPQVSTSGALATKWASLEPERGSSWPESWPKINWAGGQHGGTPPAEARPLPVDGLVGLSESAAEGGCGDEVELADGAGDVVGPDP